MKKIIRRIFAVIIMAAIFTSAFVFTACDKGGSDQGGGNKPEFTVTVSSNEGGRLEIDKTKVRFGENFTITATPDEGYILYYVGINGNKVRMKEATMVVTGVTSDFEINGVFKKPNLVISFDTNGGNEIQPIEATFGKTTDNLPLPLKKGFRFVCWKDADGNEINANTLIKKLENFTVKAIWKEIGDDEKEGLKPFCATTSFYDSGVTAYGVTWHNSVLPVYPVLQVKSGDEFVDADEATFEKWNEQIEEEWFIHAVLKVKCATEYTVRFGDESADIWSEEYTFTTRDENVDAAKFIYVTDTQENAPINVSTDYKPLKGDTYSHIVLKEAFNRFPESRFMVNGGDIVNYGAEASYWREMMDSYNEFLFKYPLMVTAGNHEDPNYYSARLDTVNKMFNVDYPEGGDSARGVYYSFDYGPMHFICLRSNDTYAFDGKIGDEQLAWFEQDIANAKARGNTKWNVAVMHEGPVEPLPGYVDHQLKTSRQWLSAFDKAGIDLLLYGHDHFIDSTVPICYDQENDTPVASAYGVGIAPHTIEKITDGQRDSVDKFVFTTNKRGTVMHQTGTAGHQFNHEVKIGDEEAALDNLLVDGERMFRRLFSSGAGYYVDKDLSTYSYVEVNDDHILVKTYGVDVMSAKDQLYAEDNTYYVDGFMLTR